LYTNAQVSNSMHPTSLTFYKPTIGPPIPLPLMACRIAAGFPKPSDDHLEARIDITRLLIDQPAATFIVQVAQDGTSMIDAGIHPGDYLVVNKAGEWSNGAIVVARIGDEFTLKRIRKRAGRVFLLAENKAFPQIELTQESDCEVWGVVTGSFRRY
jgi:DNA polymerase V